MRGCRGCLVSGVVGDPVVSGGNGGLSTKAAPSVLPWGEKEFDALCHRAFLLGGFMWVLLLNNMRSAKVERLTPVARAETQEALEAFMDREKVESYTTGSDAPNSFDHAWHKTFRKGGLLEWFNRPSFLRETFLDAGALIAEVTEGDREAGDRLQKEVDQLPDVSTGAP